jgi:aspartyl-tRNA synthetase
MGFDEAIERFGSDRPDTRFGLELRDVGELVRGCEFRVFNSVLERGDVVWALNAGARELSRADLDGLSTFVQRFGAAAVAPIPVAGAGEWGGNLAKFFSAEQMSAVNERLDAQAGDLLLFVADRRAVAARALGELRLELGARFDLIDRDRHDVLWVVDFPMFEADADGRWSAMHHPFTAPAPAHGAGELGFADPGALRSRAYDLVVDGAELGGGSIRTHTPEIQQQIFTVLGLDADEAQRRFGFLLDALRYGAPPHGGIALGIDRIVAMMAGAESIRDVIAFPKTASGQDPLTGAPEPVDATALRDLGLRRT